MKKYKKVLGTRLSKIDEKFILVKSREIFNINEIGARIFDLCNGDNTDFLISEKLSKFYNVDQKEVEHDVTTFLDTLLELQLIKVID